MRLFCSLSQKTLTSPEKVQMMTLVVACYQTWSLTDRNRYISQSRPEDADISSKGVGDDVSHYMLSGIESDGSQMRLFHSLGWNTLTSSGKVQMTILVTACYRTLKSDG